MGSLGVRPRQGPPGANEVWFFVEMGYQTGSKIAFFQGMSRPVNRTRYCPPSSYPLPFQRPEISLLLRYLARQFRALRAHQTSNAT
jgi:hypothetical protein